MHKAATTDDKRLQSTLKRLGVNTIPGIEEVNLFLGNDVVHFVNPKGAHRFPRSSAVTVWSGRTKQKDYGHTVQL